nr:MAG TPA_asm: hypothetical protein [Caudoviricetes sp.]
MCSSQLVNIAESKHFASIYFTFCKVFRTISSRQ